ncbi:hypothetical protein U9M48_012160 [Paspalum notatum var. saurae]|uniref:CCHC-type domain-containing protein n=1 Tax=Paspalum notatum var. saurae TaxID=547442 RepID=A0AAQ3SXQ6_PASNO
MAGLDPFFQSDDDGYVSKGELKRLIAAQNKLLGDFRADVTPTLHDIRHVMDDLSTRLDAVENKVATSTSSFSPSEKSRSRFPVRKGMTKHIVNKIGGRGKREEETTSTTSTTSTSWQQRKQRLQSSKGRAAPPDTRRKTDTISATTPTTLANIVCHRCKGIGHVTRECLSKRAYIATDNGGYISTSKAEEDVQASKEESAAFGGDDAEDYTHNGTYVVQRVLSAHFVEHEDKLQRHNLFQIYFIINKCRVRTIIDGESCNNLGIEVDETKIDANRSWPTPTTITQHHRCPTYELTKKGVTFHWGTTQEKAFNTLKDKLTHAPLLQLPDFGKTFELECDASGIGIGGVLLQEGKPVAYFSEKLNGPSLNYSTYDKELYVLVRVLETWQHYLWPKEFVIHSDHESLKHIRSQAKLNKRHAKWVEFIESFPYIIKHKKGKDNVIADALSRRYTLLSQLDHRIFGLETIKGLYAADFDFKEAFENCREGRTWNKYEAHGGRLMGHFGVKKTTKVLTAHFFWPKLKRDVERPVHSTTKRSPFQVVYGFNPRAPIDLISLPFEKPLHLDASQRADFIKILHETTKSNIENMNEKYKLAGSKGRKQVLFEPDLRKSKLMPRAVGPFKVLEKIDDNAYKLELPTDFGVSPTFNIADLKPYFGEEDELASRTTSFQEEEDDEGITPMVSSFLGARNSTYKDSMLPNDIIDYIERTMKALETSMDQEEDQRGVQVKMEAQFYSETTFSAFRTSFH